MYSSFLNTNPSSIYSSTVSTVLKKKKQTSLFSPLKKKEILPFATAWVDLYTANRLTAVRGEKGERIKKNKQTKNKKPHRHRKKRHFIPINE